MSLYSIRFIVRTLLEIPSGIIADSFGRIKSLLTAYSFYIFSFIAYFFAENLLFLIVPTILFGVGDAFRTGSHKAMIIEYLKINNWLNSKTTYYGHTRSWSQAGSAISSIIAALIVLFAQRIDVVFLAAIFPVLIGFGLLLTYPKDLDRKSENITNQKQLRNSLKISWSTLKKTGNIKLLINTSFYSGFHNSIKDLLQPIVQGVNILLPVGLLLEKEQKTALLIGCFYFVIYLLSTVSSRNAGKASKYFSNSLSAINGLSIIGILLGIIISSFLIFDFQIVAAILFLLFFPILSIYRPSAISEISSKIKGDIMATALSVESQLGSLLAAIIAFITGLLIDQLGLGIGLGIVSLLSLIVIVLFTIFKTGNEKNYKSTD